MVETIRHQIMEMGGRRRIEAANWETTLCPNIEKVLAKIISNARQNSVIPSDGRLFEVVFQAIKHIFKGGEIHISWLHYFLENTSNPTEIQVLRYMNLWGAVCPMFAPPLCSSPRSVACLF
ncbi:hypothetical protein Taro_039980 [Colocasia esculenta]|uniref:Uncharacterized protein n=1 Tax=Colocasia esculenta TaxID=4460 RepID=A0A843WT34_COLES|nr:hypothetical protein [Colocasia esculenta]